MSETTATINQIEDIKEVVLRTKEQLLQNKEINEKVLKLIQEQETSMNKALKILEKIKTTETPV
jgi:hypothetical protein